MSALLFALLVPEPADSARSAGRNRLADGIAIGLALAYGAPMVRLGDATARGAALPWPVDVAIGVLCALALVVRRRWPLGLALALLPFGAVSVMATGAVTVALFTVAIRRRAPVALLLGAANVLLGAAYFLRQDHPPYPLWVDLVMRAVITAAAVGWGLFVQAHRRLTRSLREHAARLEADQHLRVEQARLTERARIAREMHDVLAHRMSLVSLHAGALEVRTDARPEEVALAAGAIRASDHGADPAAGPRRSRARTRLATLTDREREVAAALGRGMSNAEISTELGMSVPTVKGHVSRLLAKLELNNRVQVALLMHDAE